MKGEHKILLLFAHPAIHKSKINKQLLAGVDDIPGITIHNLYEEYPDFHIDVKREQSLLLDSDVVVWHHPLYWYSAPAILKEWIDLVLEHGFAYGRKGKKLEGKMVFNAITAGGIKGAYSKSGINNYSIHELLVPFKQTASMCRMRYLPPFVIHGTHLLSPEQIDSHASDYKKILLSLRDGLFAEEELLKLGYINDILELKEK